MSDFTLPLPRRKRGGILKKDDNNTVIGVPFETSNVASSSASRPSLNRSKRRVSFAPEATMTTFENLTPLRNFQDRGHVTQASFGGFSKPGFGAVVDWKEERERIREGKQKEGSGSRDAALNRDAALSRDQGGVARDQATPREQSTPAASSASHRQSLSTIFGNFRPSRDSFAGAESFSESREYDVSANLSRDLTANRTAVKTSFKELFQRAMSKSRESGARDSLLLGVARDRNSIIGHVANTLVEEDETGEVEMELTEVELREKSGLGASSESRDLSHDVSHDQPRISPVPVNSGDTSLASPVKTEDDGMDFTNVPRRSRDSAGSRDSSSRDSGEMDFTNVTLARDIAEARAADESGMDFTNVPQARQSRGLSRISEADSDSMDYTSMSIPSVARIVSEEVLVRSGLSPGGSPRVREVGDGDMSFTNVPKKDRRTSARSADDTGMDFTNVKNGGFAVPATPALGRVRSQGGEGDMSFTNVPRAGSSTSTSSETPDMSFTNVPRSGVSDMSFTNVPVVDTPRGIKRRRVDDGEMEFTGVVDVPETVEFAARPDTSGMDFTGTVNVPRAEPEESEQVEMSFTRPVDVPEDNEMSFTRPVEVPQEEMSFTRPVEVPQDDMSFTRPVEVPQEEMSFTRPVEVPEQQDMSFTRPIEVPQELAFTRPTHLDEEEMSFTRPVTVPDEDMSFTRPLNDEGDMSLTNTNVTNFTRSTGTGMDFTRPVPGGIEVGGIEPGSSQELDKSPTPKLSRDRRQSRDDVSRSEHTDYEFTTFGQNLDSSTRLLSQMRDEEMEKSLEEPLEEPPKDSADHVTSHVTHTYSVPLSDSTPDSRERPLSTIAETTEREDSAGNSRGSSVRYPSNTQGLSSGVTVATNSGTFGTQFSTPQLSTPGKRPFSELSRDDTTPEQSRDDADMDLTAPMSLKHRFELLSTPRKVKVKRGGVEFGSRIGNSVSRDHNRVLSRVGDFGSPAIPSDSLTMTKFLQMIDMQFMDDFLLPGKRKPSGNPSKCSMEEYLINSYLHPHVQLYSWAVEHLRKDIEVRSANFAQLDQETLNDVPPIFVDYTSADSGVKLLLNKQFALDKQYYRVEARKSWYEWRKSISIDLYKRLATNRDLLRSDLRIIDRESETVSTEVADLKQKLEMGNTQLTQLKNLSTDVELKRQVCSELQSVQKELMPLVEELEQVNQTVTELESEVNKEVQKQDEIKTKLMEQQKRLLDNRHIDFREIEQLQEKLKKAEQKKGLKLVKFETKGDAVFESRDLVMTVSRETNVVVKISAKPSLSDDKKDAVKLLPLGEKTVAEVTKLWRHVTQFFDALAEITLALNSRYHVTADGQFELFIKLLTHKGQSRTDIHVKFPFSEILSYPHMTGCHVTSKSVYGVNSVPSFTTFDNCLEVLLSVK